MDRDDTDVPGPPVVVQHPLSDTIHRGVRNLLQISASLSTSDAHCPFGGPSKSSDRISSYLDLRDTSALAAYDESDLDNPEFLCAAAAEMYRMRRARDHILPNDLTGEPAWDMLLALYSEEPAKMTVSSVCYGSGVPQTTALRWISMLEQKGLVQRVEHPRDPKVILVSLTDEGREVVGEALKTMLRAFRF